MILASSDILIRIYKILRSNWDFKKNQIRLTFKYKLIDELKFKSQYLINKNSLLSIHCGLLHVGFVDTH